MKYYKIGLIVVIMILCSFLIMGCFEDTSSDTIQRNQQETMLKEATSVVGMPSIKNFRERRILKDIQELCDQEGLITYTYVFSEVSGKYIYLGESVGYGIPYATQYTNPEKLQQYSSYGPVILPQADPNGLFKPSSADGTWVLLRTPEGKVEPQFIEPKISVFTYKLPDRLLQ
jgi:hypothetical protein